jgi:hypothetical protein
LIRGIFLFGGLLVLLVSIEFFWLLGPESWNAWLMLCFAAYLLIYSFGARFRFLSDKVSEKYVYTAVLAVLIAAITGLITAPPSNADSIDGMVVAAAWAILIGALLIRTFANR